MKNLLQVLAVTFLTATVSCKKERTCECTTTSRMYSSSGQVYYMGSGSRDTTTVSSNKTVYAKISRRDAKTLCGDTYNSTKGPIMGSNGQPDSTISTISTKCELK